MDWQRGDRYGNVEDRRGMPMGVAGGGIGALALGLLGYFFFGINPLAIMDVVNQVSTPSQQEGRVGTPGDRTGQFVDTILSSTTDVWKSACLRRLEFFPGIVESLRRAGRFRASLCVGA
jgi:predicted metalloprotease